MERADSVLVSPVSIWEVGMLAAKGRVTVDRDLHAWTRDLFDDPRTDVAALSPQAAASAAILGDDFPGDPADRLLYATGLDLGVPITGIAEATFARALSGSVPQREAARGVLPAHTESWQVGDRDAFVEEVRLALYASKVVAYSQGFDQIAAASAEFGWDIDRGAMARIWRGGCIIRARFLDRITEAYEREADLPLLLADPYFTQAVGTGVASWRRVVAGAARNGIG
jgi:6-phosphogluconate dehydrogenase